MLLKDRSEQLAQRCVVRLECDGVGEGVRDRVLRISLEVTRLGRVRGRGTGRNRGRVRGTGRGRGRGTGRG